jgi:HK97 family phage portal protein
VTTIVTHGDRLLTPAGRESWLKRPGVPFASFGQGQLAMDGRVVSYQQLYEQQPWVAVVVNKISRQIVRLPWGVFRERDGEAEPLTDHPLTRVLGKPWSRASASTLKQKLAFPVLVHGNGVVAKVRPGPGATPTGLRPLDWRGLSPLLLDGEILIGWEYRELGETVVFDVHDVIHLAWEGGAGALGVSPLRQLGVTLRTEDNAQRYQSSSFENGVRPSGALVLPGDVDLDADERAELREEIRAMHGGPDRNAKMALLSGGMDWKPFSHTAVEAELIEQRKLNREEVAAVYDIDPPMIGILDHATYSNVGEMHRMLYGPTLGPWLRLICDDLKAQLIETEPAWADDGLFVAFDLTEVLKANTAEEMQAVTSGIGSGVLTPNEGRQRFGLRRSASEAADDLYMPVNNLSPLGSTPEPPTLRITQQPDPDPDPDSGKALLDHIERWKQIAASHAGAGRPFDRDRFISELKADVPIADAERVADQFIADHMETQT